MNEIKTILYELQIKVTKLDKMSNNADNVNFDAISFHKLYAEICEIVEHLEDIDNDFSNEENDEIEYLFDRTNYIYEKSIVYLSINTINNYEKLNEKIDKQQGVQFATFSIFLTILAFVLTNTKVLSIAEICTKTVLLVNLILTCCFNFVLFYCFFSRFTFIKKLKKINNINRISVCNTSRNNYYFSYSQFLN